MDELPCKPADSHQRSDASSRPPCGADRSARRTTEQVYVLIGDGPQSSPLFATQLVCSESAPCLTRRLRHFRPVHSAFTIEISGPRLAPSRWR